MKVVVMDNVGLQVEIQWKTMMTLVKQEEFWYIEIVWTLMDWLTQFTYKY